MTRPPEPDPHARVNSLNDQAELALPRHPGQVQLYAAEALQLAQSVGDAAGAVRARILLATGNSLQGRLDEALPELRAALQVAQEMHLHELTARALNSLGVAYVKRGEIGSGLRAFLRGLQTLDALQTGTREQAASAEFRRLRIRLLTNLGNLYLDLRQFDQSLLYLRQALYIAQEHGEEPYVVVGTLNVARNLHELGVHADALALNESVLPRVRAGGFLSYEATLLVNMAANLVALERPAEALERCDAAERLCADLGDEELACELGAVRGRALAALGRKPEAREVLERALAQADALGLAPRQINVREHLSLVLERQGHYREALRYAREAEERSRAALLDLARHRAEVERGWLEHRAAAARHRTDALTRANAALKEAQDRLAHQVRHDRLTGLPNRLAFEEDLARALDSADGRRPVLAVLFIDLDRFKQVNDTLGHTFGDALLGQVAERLRAALPSGAAVYRQGGDEFMVMVPDVTAHEQAHAVAQTLLASLKAPFVLAGRSLVITMSVGVAVSPVDGHDIGTLQKNADLAMYSAKRTRSGVQAFRPALSEVAEQQLQLEQELRGALSRGALQLHYQPIVDTLTLRPYSVEALVRWPHPTRGLLTPERFLRVAEVSDLMVPLGQWVLREAVAQLAQWRRRWPDLKISVNVAARQFEQPSFWTDLEQLLTGHGLPLSAIELEVTEDDIHDHSHVQACLPLVRQGLRLAIDDFGTGYSSLSRLYNLPVQGLKLDRSLMKDVRWTGLSPQSDPQVGPDLSGGAEAAQRSFPHQTAGALVRGIIRLAREAGLQVVVEGVETVDQLEQLQRWQPDFIQGYLMSRPAPAHEIEAVLNELMDDDLD